jgi:ABC-type antimicrobial peptide transport system permease subunit
VLNYAVIEQRREIALRMALGARAAHVVGRVTTRTMGMACVGALAGLAGGLACGRFLDALLFQVKTTDASTLAIPLLTLAASAIVAALPPALRAVRIDPALILRAD